MFSWSNKTKKHEQYNKNLLMSPMLEGEEVKFADTKRVVRGRKSKTDRQHNGQKRKGTDGQTTIYKTLHRKLRIEQHESH